MFGPFSFLIFFMINKYLEQVPSNFFWEYRDVKLGEFQSFVIKDLEKFSKFFIKKFLLF